MWVWVLGKHRVGVGGGGIGIVSPNAWLHAGCKSHPQVVKVGVIQLKLHSTLLTQQGLGDSMVCNGSGGGWRWHLLRLDAQGLCYMDHLPVRMIAMAAKALTPNE